MSENRLKLPKDVAVALSHDDEVDGWKILSHEIVDEWRWGNVYELVVQKTGVLGIWAYTYRQQLDGEYSDIDDEGDEVEFYRVVPRVKQVIEYVRAKEGE